MRRGSVLQIVRASIRKSPMWPDSTGMELSTNMRVQRCLVVANVEESRLLDSWAKWLLAVGRGTIKAARNTPEPYEAMSEDEAEEEETPRSVARCEAPGRHQWRSSVSGGRGGCRGPGWQRVQA